MARDWESTMSSWAAGPSATEKQRADNAQRLIYDAINGSDKLKNRNIKVFTQGSYRNKVNVKQNSDVDVGVVCYDTFFPEYPDENIKALASRSFTDSTYTYATFKNEIEEALVNKFGRPSVSRGNKSFDIQENSYRVEADVAAFFENRRYYSSTAYHSGVEMLPDNGFPQRVRNWPEQHYRNGVDKNTRSSRRYKRTTRIFKSLANEMAERGNITAQKIPGFLLECLSWNLPDYIFNEESHYDRLRSSIVYLFQNTREEKLCSEWGEVSELKYLFRQSQPWTRTDANAFMVEAWNYIGYK